MDDLNGHSRQSSYLSTINPRALNSTDDRSGPFPGKRFIAEEWEDWMQWDGTTESTAPQTPSDHSSPGYPAGSVSHGSTSPSEAESFLHPPLTPVYRIPSIDDGSKIVQSSPDSRRAPNKKRKTTIATDVQEVRIRQPKGQKISHNVIEKRYRTNLNDKIAKLRDSVPILKTAFEATQRQHTKDGDESGSEESGSEDKAVASGVKFNKATVLTKATEYIEQLERANAKLLSENSTLRKRVRDNSSDACAPKPLYFRADEANAKGSSLPNQVKVEYETTGASDLPVSPQDISGKIPVAAEFQKLRAEASDQPSYAPASAATELISSPASLERNVQRSPRASEENSTGLIDFDSVQGAIPVPDYLRRNRIPIAQQQHYAPAPSGGGFGGVDSDPFVIEDDESPNWWPRNRASKLLLGSLAGLMIMEGFSANVDGPHRPAHPKHGSLQKRRTQFLPDDFYTESRGFRAQIRQRIIDFSHSPQGKKTLPVLFLSAIILAVVFLAFVYLSRNDPKARRRANSVSSNPELDTSEQRISDRRILLCTCDEKATATTDVYGPIGRLPTSAATFQKTRHFFLFSEARSRIRACWKILTEGEDAQFIAPQI